MNEIVIFENEQRSVQVQLKAESIWLTQAQMAEVFGTSTDNISLHLKNIYKTAELTESATTEDFSVVRQEGKRQVTRRLKHYNLDAIISVGYRVNSTHATRFRQWATRVLREHLTQGYSLNEYRLAQQGLAELEQAVELLGRTLTRQQLVSDLGQEVVGLILGYARTWRLLQDYDEGALGLPAGAQPAKGILGMGEARRALDAPSHPRGACRALAVFRHQEPSVFGRQQTIWRVSFPAVSTSGRYAPDFERAGTDSIDPTDR